MNLAKHIRLLEIEAKREINLERYIRSWGEASAILRSIKKKNPTNCSTIKTIYNARTRMRLKDYEGQTQLQELMKCLEGREYVTCSRREETTQVLVDLFFAHPIYIHLAVIFPKVFVVDCTYKINRINLPIFSIIVGIAST